MRVTALELFAVPPRWLFLKLSTDEGISGWGEPIVEGRVATTRAAVEELGELLIGRDPFRIERRGWTYNEDADLLDYVVDESVFDVVDGHMAVPAGPGLGAEIDEARVREAARDARMWHNPVWRNDDGRVAEW